MIVVKSDISKKDIIEKMKVLETGWALIHITDTVCRTWEIRRKGHRKLFHGSWMKYPTRTFFHVSDNSSDWWIKQKEFIDIISKLGFFDVKESPAQIQILDPEEYESWKSFQIKLRKLEELD